MRFLGAPYPIETNVYGYLHTTSDLDQIKSDMLILLLTNPGERVMLPQFGTPLRELIFEPSDDIIIDQAKQMIAKSIALFEPRVTVSAIDVSTSAEDSLSISDNRSQIDHILFIRIAFYDPANIQAVQELKLQFPLGTG